LLGALLAAALSGCSLFGGGDPSLTENVHLVAIYPIREVPGPADEDSDRPVLETHAGRAVTAQIYGILAEQTRYHFVPDLAVADMVAQIDPSLDEVAAARELALASEADAVLFGTVYRFQDRVGPRMAASQPASVSFDLAMYSTAADEVVWEGQFDQTQRALTSNFFDAWMFWRVGPHWFSSRELAGLGVEKLLREIE